MRIGIISDIHSDLRALQDAIELLNNQQCDQIVCCGGVLHAFRHMPRNNEVIETLIQHHIPCVMGNHDDIILADQRDLRTWEFAIKSLDSHRLVDEAFNFLDSLPEKLSFEWCCKTVAVTHGTYDGLHPKNNSQYFQAFAEAIQADIALVGHIHSPLRAKVENVWIFNPGSICGRHYAGSRTCAMLQLPESDFQVFSLDNGLLIETPVLDFNRQEE